MAGKDRNKGEKPAQPVDPGQESLFREIEEDLREERYATLWRRYGILVIGAAVALVLGVAGFEVWKGMQRSELQAASDRYLAAAAEAAADPAEARQAFGDLAFDGPGGYAFVGALREAAALRRSGDTPGAVAIYDRLATTADDRLHADLARLLGVLAELEDPTASADPAALAERLAPLAEADAPWRQTARELLAYLALRTGEAERARTLFTALAEDATAPASLRTRAARVAAALGGR